MTYRTSTQDSGEEMSMSWWVVALVAWAVVAVVAGLLLGAVARTADRREHAMRVPSFSPEHWSLTPTR